MSCLAGKPLFAYHWDSAFFWLEVPRELFDKFGPAAEDLNAQSKMSEDRHTMYLEWQTDGHAFLENYLEKDLRARKFYGGPSGVICDPRSGAFANIFECITKCDGPVSFIRCLPPLTN